MLLWIGFVVVALFAFWFWNGSWLKEENNLNQLRAEQASISHHDPLAQHLQIPRYDPLSRPPSEDE
jgi:hypothetical protein